MSERFTVAVVGSGSLGTYYGARLGLAGAEVHFLMRGDLAAVRARGSLRVQVEGKQLELRPVSVHAGVREIGPVDLVLVTLKTTANTALTQLLPPLLGSATSVLTLQNGLGADDQIAAIVGAERVLGGLAFIAVNRTGPGEVTCFHAGSLTLGELGRPATDRVERAAGWFRRAGIIAHVVDDLLEARWRKLVWNVPFNGLAVAHNLTTDLICANPQLAAEVWELMREVQAAAAGFGFTIPDEFLRQQFDVTPPMGPYLPSSLVDYRAGRGVEVESIWGEPLRRARAQGVATPRLAALYDRLKSAAAS